MRNNLHTPIVFSLFALTVLLVGGCASTSSTESSAPSTASSTEETVSNIAETATDETTATVAIVEEEGSSASVETIEELPQASAPVMTVYKSPTCGCCQAWVEIMQEEGFTVIAENVNDMSVIKQEHGVLPHLQSCHTATVDGYVIEGHVPIDSIQQLLAERPDVSGLAVPGMPIGSPGMEVDGYGVDPFDVVTFDASGNTEIFASYPQ